MTTLETTSQEAPYSSDQRAWLTLADEACRRMAPLWPLDSFVAVNPYLGLIEQPFHMAGRYLEATVGEKLFMDRQWFAQKIERGEILDGDLERAVRQCGQSMDATVLKRQLRQDRAPAKLLPLLAVELDRPDAPPISEFVVEQISGFLGAYYDRGQSLWRLPDQGGGLYASWRQYSLIDRSAHAVGLKGAREHLLGSPKEASQAMLWALERIDLPSSQLPDYLFATLKSVGGWASWCRYLHWQDELQGRQSDDLHDLLAIRLVWDALILMGMSEAPRRQWRRKLAQWHGQHAVWNQEAADIDETLLTAAEIAFRRRVTSGLNRALPNSSEARPMRPQVQAAFCIDVRSEVFRRHLESCLPDAETIGFAGFFGVPLDYCRLGEDQARTHTPVLLNPGYRAHETGSAEIAARRHTRLGRSANWKQFKLSAASCFTFVESSGLSYIPRLIADALGWHRPSGPPDEAGLTEAERKQLHPQLVGKHGALSDDEAVDLAEGMLRGLGVTETFAPIIILAGHGSSTTNNPHRAGLDCGACAGQTGEVSARVAADLLNVPAVRLGLAGRGIHVPMDTRFVAAMHDTTTDKVSLLDVDKRGIDVSSLAPLTEALERAGELTRLERLVTLDASVDTRAAERHVTQRGRDWSQVRPEWGLAGNAAFIAAPRWRTRGFDLGGRAFLHDYDWQKDEDFRVLALIMTAPLVVANWINLQYYGSTVDNLRQGSGNKVLHNVVGGLVGVLEGNGGDLRVGLSMQSLHDGEQWRHEPLRLSAFIEAPTEAMDRIIAGHEMLKQLVDHRWLSVLQVAVDGSVRRRFGQGDWRPEQG